MEKIFLDTNILLDAALKRIPHAEHSAAIYSSDQFLKYTSSLSVSNFHFLIRKDFDKRIARTHVGALIHHCHIIDVNAAMIQNAYDSLFHAFTDFEDAIQHYCAVAHSMDAIITRNDRDFRNSEIPVFSPKKFVRLFHQ